jgi:hypothetical protein
MKLYRLAALAAVMLAAFVAYAPALSNDFVNADDELMFTAIDENVRVPLDNGGFMPLGRALAELIYRIGGPDPAPYHAVGLLFHVVNSGLLFLVILKLLEIATSGTPNLEGGRIACSAAAACLFAAHPAHAEVLSVASSFADVVAAFLFLTAVACYVRSTQNVPFRRGWLAAAFAADVLCAGTRWTAVGLPVVLVALDVFPLKRIQRLRDLFSGRAAKVWLEKVPFVVVSAAVVWLNIGEKLGANGLGTSREAVFHPAAIAAGVVFYAWKWLSPGEPALYYVLDRASVVGPVGWTCVALVGAVVAGWLSRAKKAAAGAAAASCFLAPLAPILFVATNGLVTAHDRYSYIPFMSLSAALAAVLLAAWTLGNARRVLLGFLPVVLALCAAAGFCAEARALCGAWHDQHRLWSPGARGRLNAFFGHAELGKRLLRERNIVGALDQFRRQLAAHPGDEQTRRLAAQCLADEARIQDDAGVSFASRGMAAQAEASFRKAIESKPDFAPAYYNMGVFLYRRGRVDEAVVYFNKSLALDPRNDEARAFLKAVAPTNGAQPR